MIFISKKVDTLSKVKELVANLRYLNNVKSGQRININKIGSITPLSITPLIAEIYKKKLLINSRFEKLFHLYSVKSITNNNELLKFEKAKEGIHVLHLNIKKYKEKKIKPFNFLYSFYLNLLMKNIISNSKFIQSINPSTLGFILGEMIDNIEEHSNSENVYIFGKYSPNTRHCELCIIDDGIGLFNSLKNAGRKVINSAESLKQILSVGLSAKSNYNQVIRGTGINNTRSTISNNEIKGEFFIMSGNDGFLDSFDLGEIFINFKDYFYNGTIVMMKLYEPEEPFNLYKYVK